MNSRKIRFIYSFFIINMWLLSACSTMHKVEGVSEYSQVVLQVGDRVKATMKDGTNIELIVKNIDLEYFYGNENLKINRNEIKALEFTRFDPGNFYFALIGFLIFGVLFSG